MSKKRFWGIDDGFSETKIITDDGRSLRIPSQAKAGSYNYISLSGGESSKFGYACDDGEFVIGDIEVSDSTAFDDYPVSPLNRVVVSHALRETGAVSDDQLVICTGLPVKKYYRMGRLNEQMILAKKANLLKNDVRSVDGFNLARIVQHEVLAEAVTSWMDHVLQRDTSGQLEINKDLAHEKIGIIDIGGRTTDIAVIKGGELDIEHSSTIEVGMLKIYEQIRETMLDIENVELTDGQVRSAARHGKFKLYGKNHEIAEVVAAAEKTVVHRIHNEVMRKLGKAADFDSILFVGGTVNQIRPHLDNWFPHQVIDHDPGFANARGMQKYAEKFLSQQ